MKTNIELALEAGICQYERFDSVDGGNQLDRYTALVEARMMERLLEGAGEPYATLHHDDGYFTTKQREHDLRYGGPIRTDVYTSNQIAAAVLRERERVAKLFETELSGREFFSEGIAEIVRNRGTK